MTALAATLHRVETLRQRIAAHGKMDDTQIKRIEYKFRLECNYHSNKIEGGTLTKQETRSVMTGNITVQGKPLKDIREMQGHDEAMKDIFAMGKGEKRLSEKRIMQMHRRVIVAETAEQAQEIGRWKSTGNHVLNYRGERFDFAAPEEVPQAMHDLLDWLNAGLDKIHRNAKDAPNALLLAFEFHLRYVTIHPFLDGNGRTGRLLSNLVLVSLGYPPFWVAEGSEKEAYGRCLADVQAYGGAPDLLYNFLAGLVERSLQITLNALEGQEIEDLDDWKKELALLKNRLPGDDALRALSSTETIRSVCEQSIKPVIAQLLQDLLRYDDLFLKKEIWLGVEGSSTLSDADTAMSMFDHLLRSTPPRENLHFSYILSGYRKSKEKQFSLKCRVVWTFGPYEYAVSIEDAPLAAGFGKQYDAFYSAEEINALVAQCGAWMLQQLRRNVADGA